MFIALIFVGFNCSAQAKFDFEKKVHKFGHIEEGVQLSTEFNFKNKGDEPLIITKYEVTCSCTKVEFPKEPILPGGSGTISVRFDTNDKIGWQYREILLFSNAKKNPFTLEIQAKVIND